jgi:predicted dehydrogenase
LLRFGVIGTSFISDWFMDEIAHTDGTGVTAICSRSVASGEAFAARYGISHIFHSSQ